MALIGWKVPKKLREYCGFLLTSSGYFFFWIVTAIKSRHTIFNLRFNLLLQWALFWCWKKPCLPTVTTHLCSQSPLQDLISLIILSLSLSLSIFQQHHQCHHGNPISWHHELIAFRITLGLSLEKRTRTCCACGCFCHMAYQWLQILLRVFIRVLYRPCTALAASYGRSCLLCRKDAMWWNPGPQCNRWQNLQLKVLVDLMCFVFSPLRAILYSIVTFNACALI